MLSKVLSKSTCADCRFCCSFRRCSLWETPLFPMEVVDKYRSENVGFKMENIDGRQCGRLELLHKYSTEDPNEEVACSFLDHEKGCVLPEEEKPFDCKIWPLRIMKKEDNIVVALTPTCPAINSYPVNVMEELVNEGLGERIRQYAKEHPYIIKEYREGFPVLMTF